MKNLIIPVYLNQKLVFDLLAMLQGGISTVTAVSTSTSNSNSGSEKISAGFGLSEAFSTLLKINISGDKTNSVQEKIDGTTSEERVHTPASLFYQLRNFMKDNDSLKELSDKKLPKAGDFVEFEGNLSRNPIIETLDSFSEMMGMAEVFSDKPQKKSKNNKSSELDIIRQQIESFSEGLKAGSTIDVTANNLSSGYSAVITLERGFLSDPLMSDLVDGQFKVMGKVIRSINDNSESINLLRKTAMSKMPSAILLQLLEALEQMGTDQGFDLPELVWEIEGPTMHIIPVAIYA